GAGGYPGGNNKGRSYVVFGGPGVGRSGNILLSSLNGTNGFKLDGENNNDYSGWSVSGAGDINGDSYSDLLIGAGGYPGGNNKGRSYVVFGGQRVGSTGNILLSSLNGTNGFKLDAENNGDWGGNSVSTIGDINGDGYADLLIGAYAYPNGTTKGRGYVVFGSSVVGSGNILLSSLNGDNGFKLDGENNSTYSIWAVNAAGDINSDGYADLVIGAFFASGNKGHSYVVFGGPGIGSSGTISLSSLDGINGFKLNDEDYDYSGPVSTGGDINGDGIVDLLIGATGTGGNKGRTYVVFGDTPPILVNNSLFLSVGATIILNSTYLGAYDRNHNNNTLIFVTSSVIHGQFETTYSPGVMLTNFTQQQVSIGTIQFVHDGSLAAPNYNISVYSTGIAWTGPSAVNIRFTVPLTIVNNQLTLNNGQTLLLTLDNLKALDSGVNNSQIVFTVANVQNGYFATTPTSKNSSKNITSFNQAQILNGDIEFVHSGDKQAPSYWVLASDGIQSTLPSLASIVLIGAPIITENTLNITTGGTITLTPNMLNVTMPIGIAPNQVNLSVNDLQHATITSKLMQTPVSNFTLADVVAGDIQLTQDGSLVSPSYTITAIVIPTELSSAPVPADVLFSNRGVYAPQLVNNYLIVTQGKAARLSNRYLSAQEPSSGQALDNQTMFYVSNIEYGHFSLIDQPQTWITSFSQQQLLESQVQFVQDGSAATPGYQTSVVAFGLQSASLPASIFFNPINVLSPSPVGDSSFSTWQKTVIGAMISGGIGIGFALLQICMKRLANKKLMQVLGQADTEYERQVVRPVMKEIAQRIKITHFMNAITNKELMAFKSAVRSLLSALERRQVDLNFSEMKESKKDQLINEIGNEVYRWMKTKERGCRKFCPGLHAFFKPQMTSEGLQDAVEEIADQITQTLRTKTHRAQVSLSIGLSVSGNSIYQGHSDKKRSMDMLELDSPSRKTDKLEQPEEVPIAALN
ncbi:MAG: FG-GAP repeat protein, partial [Proteobacteria bacterium]|nr:FG-GAP repeat protein [Pseudomonadota bacterium]